MLPVISFRLPHSHHQSFVSNPMNASSPLVMVYFRDCFTQSYNRTELKPENGISNSKSSLAKLTFKESGTRLIF